MGDYFIPEEQMVLVADLSSVKKVMDMDRSIGAGGAGLQPPHFFVMSTPPRGPRASPLL